MREQDRAAPGLRVHGFEDVLEEGIVRAPLRRGAEEVAPPDILLPRAAVPFLDGVRRIGEDHVESAEFVALREGGGGQRVAAGNLEIRHAMDHEVHPRDGGGDGDQFLPVKAHGARVATAPFCFRKAGDQHATGAAGRVINALARLRLQHLRHQMDQRAVGVELLRGVPAVVGELLDQIFVAVAKFVLRHGGQRETVLGEVFDQVLERGVGHLTLVGPVGIAEDALQALRVGGLDSQEGREHGPPHIFWRAAHVVPMRAFGDDEAVIGRGGCVAFVVGFVERILEILVPDVGEAFEEHQREDVLLVVAGIDEAAQQRRRAPEIAFKLALGEIVGHCSQPPSVRTLRR